jgi:hypothetical protein
MVNSDFRADLVCKLVLANWGSIFGVEDVFRQNSRLEMRSLDLPQFRNGCEGQFQVYFLVMTPASALSSNFRFTSAETPCCAASISRPPRQFGGRSTP